MDDGAADVTALPDLSGSRPERLAREVASGMSGATLESELRKLKTSGPLWQLKVNCLYYCRFVHLHHHAEDVLLFPAMREADPSIAPVVDRLEADHLRVSELLGVVESAAERLTADEGGDARESVVLALLELRGHLLEHLDYEELQAGPVMRRLDRIPWGKACSRATEGAAPETRSIRPMCGDPA